LWAVQYAQLALSHEDLTTMSGCLLSLDGLTIVYSPRSIASFHRLCGNSSTQRIASLADDHALVLRDQDDIGAVLERFVAYDPAARDHWQAGKVRDIARSVNGEADN